MEQIPTTVKVAVEEKEEGENEDGEEKEKTQKKTEGSLPNPEGTPILGYEAHGPSRRGSTRGDFIKSHSKHSKDGGDAGLRGFYRSLSWSHSKA